MKNSSFILAIVVVLGITTSCSTTDPLENVVGDTQSTELTTDDSDDEIFVPGGD